MLLSSLFDLDYTLIKLYVENLIQVTAHIKIESMLCLMFVLGGD